MPTPFMHLHIAENIHTALVDKHPEMELFMQEDTVWSAFYLGSVAPDYQVICDIPRESTHFYGMPPKAGNMGYDRMFRTYPKLANASTHAPAHAAFIAAYAAHLLLDLVWLREILYPMFYKSTDFADNQESHLVHLALLTYLDGLAYAALPATAGTTLDAAKPDDWLPFAADEDVVKWQSLLATQLLPDGERQTESIFASRLGLTAKEFGALIADEAWRQDYLFSRIPIDRIQESLDTAVTRSVAVVYNYLNPD